MEAYHPNIYRIQRDGDDGHRAAEYHYSSTLPLALNTIRYLTATMKDQSFPIVLCQCKTSAEIFLKKAHYLRWLSTIVL